MTIMMPGLNNNKGFEIAPYGRFSVWVTKNNSICYECYACKTYAGRQPSKYCPECGALMLNADDARNEYSRQLSEFSQGGNDDSEDPEVERND